jgi:thioredoxin-related protein
MRAAFKVFIFLLAGLMMFSQVAVAINWGRNLDSALRKAAAEGKLVMVDFYTEWCGWCKVMEKNTFSNSEVNSLASKFVCVKVDGDRSRDLVRKYNIKGYPTTIFLNEKGMAIERVTGYLPPDQFADKMKALLSRHKVAPSGKDAPKAEKKADTGDLALTGIFHSADSPKAVINNTIVGIGDEVSGAKVIRITETEVTLSRDGKEIKLRME